MNQVHHVSQCVSVGAKYFLAQGSGMGVFLSYHYNGKVKCLQYFKAFMGIINFHMNINFITSVSRILFVLDVIRFERFDNLLCNSPDLNTSLMLTPRYIASSSWRTGSYPIIDFKGVEVYQRFNILSFLNTIAR